MNTIYIVGTADTKPAELAYLRDLVARAWPRVALVDIGTRKPGTAVDIAAGTIAACHPDGADAVLSGDDRGRAVAAMGIAFARFIAGRDDIAGVIGIGGGGGTSIVCAGMRGLPLGVPKIMVSTIASGDVAPYVDVSDIVMMPSVTDIAGLNSLSRKILHNAAAAIVGMASDPAPEGLTRRGLGLTMFGVTTPCVTAMARALSDDFDPLVFHATGTGGRTMEKMADSGLLAGFADMTTTEIADLVVGGVLPATEDRLGAVARTGLPWVGSVGALDMVNFWASATVPERFAGRTFYHHNPNVTLMRTTAEECARIGAWIAGRLNRCAGEVRLLIPEMGVSALDIAGGPFFDTDADAALFGAIERGIEATNRRQVIRLPLHINDPAFAAEAVQTVRTLIDGGR